MRNMVKGNISYNGAYAENHVSYDGALSARSYNGIIGASILIGLVITTIFSYLCTGFIMPMEMAHPFIFSIAYLLIILGLGMVASNCRTAGSAFAVYVIETAVVGALLSTFIPFLGMDVIIRSLGYTIVTVAGMICVAMIVPNVFAGLGTGLFVSLLISIIVELVATFVFHQDLMIMNYVVLVIFSLYIGYDWVKGAKCAKTARNAIFIAASLYIDIVNIFIRFAEIFARSNKNN